MHRWRNKSKLDNHLSGSFHSGYATWARRVRQSQDPNTKVKCPYCPEDHDGFHNVPTLTRHIEKSTEESTSQEHEDLKRQDGWFEDDFRGAVSKWTRSERRIRAERRLSALGFEDNAERKELMQAVRHPKIPGIMKGPHGALVPGRFRQFIRHESPSAMLRRLDAMPEDDLPAGIIRNRNHSEEMIVGRRVMKHIKVEAFPSGLKRKDR